MDLDTVADELYALDPAEFTATRTQLEKRARADGDKELARQIHQLRKPTVTAWLANLLARERPDSLRPLTELGGQLREAQQTLHGDALRQLSRQRHQLVHALVREARELAAGAGQKVTEQVARELEQTLEAALADPAAAEVILAGRLTTGLQHAGFGPQTAAPSRPAAAKTSTSRGTATSGKAGKPGKADKADQAAGEAEAAQHRQEAARAAARRDVEDAEQALQSTAEALQVAEDAAEHLEHRQRDLLEQIAELQRALAETEEELPGVRRDLRTAQRDRDRAAQARNRAERVRNQAQTSLDAISDLD